MKVGILTLPLWNNFGGILQSYALKKTLCDFGCDVTLIDYQYDVEAIDRLIAKKIKNIIKATFLLPFNKRITETFDIKQQTSVKTRDFVIKEMSPLISVRASNIRNREVITNLDTIVVGSDQVWRKRYSPNLYDYYLDFVKTVNVKKVSYAASFGSSNIDYSTDEINKVKDLLKRFSSISVRESDAVDIVKTEFEADACHVLDPTMLLTKNDYLSLLDKYNVSYSENNSGLFVYILDKGTYENFRIIELEETLKLKHFEVKPKVIDSLYYYNKENYIYPCVTQWLKAFFESEYTLVDSFHGCVFSIIFNKPFIVLGNEERGMSRFISLLKIFDLEDRLVTKDQDIEQLINREIDWRSVNKLLHDNRFYSFEFLKEALDI
ncbi:hypothetical protein A9261_12750 [Vibrio tasmaniensis]|nr:hypothetical protein A9261_12750 [Vibrio tasmaniensis]